MPTYPGFRSFIVMFTVIEQTIFKTLFSVLQCHPPVASLAFPTILHSMYSPQFSWAHWGMLARRITIDPTSLGYPNVTLTDPTLISL